MSDADTLKSVTEAYIAHDACGFKKAIDQVSDGQARVQMLMDVYDSKQMEGWSLGLTNKHRLADPSKDTSTYWLADPDYNPFYELTLNSKDQKTIVDETPKDCK